MQRFFLLLCFSLMAACAKPHPLDTLEPGEHGRVVRTPMGMRWCWTLVGACALPASKPLPGPMSSVPESPSSKRPGACWKTWPSAGKSSSSMAA